MMVTWVAKPGTLPMATPPSLTKSLALRSPVLPAPTTTKRATSSPAGARISSADPFLPLNCSASAARVTRSPLGARILWALDPKLSPSSQNTTRTPLAGLEKGTNSSLRAPAMVIRSSLTVPVGSIGGMCQGKPCIRREATTKLASSGQDWCKSVKFFRGLLRKRAAEIEMPNARFRLRCQRDCLGEAMMLGDDLPGDIWAAGGRLVAADGEGRRQQ